MKILIFIYLTLLIIVSLLFLGCTDTGNPKYDKGLIRYNDEWITREEYARRIEGNDYTPTQTQPTHITSEQEITAIIWDTLGTCNREGLEKVSNIYIVNAGYGYNIDIHFAIDDNLFEAWIIDGAMIDIRDTIEALYTCGIDIQWVDMYGSFSMIDKYGNAEEKEVIHVRLGHNTANNIDWDNITSDMLFEILDFKDIHPAFKK